MKRIDIVSSLIVSLFISTSAATPVAAQTPTPTPSPVSKSVAFEVIVGSNPKFLFYRTDSLIEVNFALITQEGGFVLKADDSITPGSISKFPPTTVFELTRESGELNQVSVSSLCFPHKISASGNPYFKSLTCNEEKSVCDIEFNKNYGGSEKKSVPFLRAKDGSFQIAAKHFALALVGGIPNKTEEFKDINGKNLRFGRFAVSAFTCKTSETSDAIATCSWTAEKDQNPFPIDRPWDDCKP